jgi:hypothetical protein
LSWPADGFEHDARDRRRFRPTSDADALRRITAVAVIAAVALNAGRFFQHTFSVTGARRDHDRGSQGL